MSNPNINKNKVLFVCVHNSARSQIAEVFLNRLGGNKFEAESAGIEPGKLNPLVIEAMREIGIDISGHSTKSVFELLETGKLFNYVITVCDETSAEKCPVFPGMAKPIHWPFQDPNRFQGSYEERLVQVKQVRDEIRYSIERFILQYG